MGNLFKEYLDEVLVAIENLGQPNVLLPYISQTAILNTYIYIIFIVFQLIYMN